MDNIFFVMFAKILMSLAHMDGQLTMVGNRDYGRQVLVDHGLLLTTSFMKEKGEGSGFGGDWAVRLDAKNER
jgi:hypothetical protein